MIKANIFMLDSLFVKKIHVEKENKYSMNTAKISLLHYLPTYISS